MNLLHPAAPDDPSAARARRIGAYQQAQRDARASVAERATLQERNTAVRQAYDRGRRDERARHPRRRGSPFLTLIVLLALVAGACALYLAYQPGGFANGGRLVDQDIANTTATAAQATHNAADQAGDALENAGQAIKQKAGG